MPWIQPGIASYQWVISRAATIIRDTGMKEVHPETMRQFASEACRDFCRMTEIVRVRQLMTLIAGQQLYDIPHDCLRPNQLSVIPAGYDHACLLDVVQERRILDGLSVATAGTPVGWYMENTRGKFGLYPVPDGGGFEGEATGGSTATIILPTTASSSDDFYNGMDVRLLTGLAEEQESTVSDYVGSTRTATLSTTLTGAVASGDRVQVHPDSVILDYFQKGQDYTILPVAGAVASAVATIKPYQIGTSTADFNRPKGYFNGCMLEMTSGTLLGMRTLIRSQTSAGATAIFTLHPEFPGSPVNADTFKVVQVPNVPNEYAHYLADYVVWKAVIREHPGLAAEHLILYLNGVEQAKMHDPNPQAQMYEGVNFHNWDGWTRRGW